MTREELEDAADRLAAKYPSTARVVILGLLVEAQATIHRLTGERDVHAVEDLVQLRLDVRTRGG